MQSQEKEISYQTTNSYSTLNSLTEKTETIWLVFHGMGYLSRYFLKYFKTLDSTTNYIIAPQAQSKYYIPPKFKHVGASWLTRENTIRETENVLNYIDAVLSNESINGVKKLIVMGYSQGVSIAMRYVASRRLNCQHLILHSGGIPKELEEKDFNFLSDEIKISHIYGTKDEFLNEERIAQETQRSNELFGDKVTIHSFEGTHEVNVELMKQLA
ncbi:MAG: alpha/beta hydrolase [bacterium]